MFFLFSIKSELKNMSKQRLEAQYGEINGKIPKLAIELILIIFPFSKISINLCVNSICPKTFTSNCLLNSDGSIFSIGPATTQPAILTNVSIFVHFETK